MAQKILRNRSIFDYYAEGLDSPDC